MGSITEPPEVLGQLIGAALVGTFFGVLMSYGFVAPLASAIKASMTRTRNTYQCMKAGLLAHMQGYPPAVSVEFARKVLLSTDRPNFYEVEAGGERPAAGLSRIRAVADERPIIIKRIKKVAAGHHGGAWKVAYADFVTAMMAFFLLLWLLNAVTEEQKNGIAALLPPDPRGPEHLRHLHHPDRPGPADG